MTTSHVQRIEIVARAMEGPSDVNRGSAALLLASADPNVLRALAEHVVDNAPDAVVSALAEAGVLSERRWPLDDGFSGQVTDPEGRTVNIGREATHLRRFVTRWSGETVHFICAMSQDQPDE